MSIEIPAIRFRQGKHTLYAFHMDAKRLHEYAVVRRLERDEDGALQGFQRGEERKHIENIRDYLDGTPDPLIPNALVLGFRKRPKFRLAEGGEQNGFGILTLNEGDNAFIVDGQQRTAAIFRSERDAFPMAMIGFVAEDDREMREQFFRLNQTKRLPTPLMNELLGSLGEVFINDQTEQKRVPAVLVERLNSDEDSPLRGAIRTSTHGDGEMLGSTLIRALIPSIEGGGLYEFRESATAIEDMLGILKSFWGAVRQVFNDAWNGNQRESKLLSAAGVLSLSALMDVIVEEAPEGTRFTRNYFAARLRRIQGNTHWTEGVWNYGPNGKVAWDNLESTMKSVKLLGDHLIRLYRKAARAENTAEIEAA